jgi:hypothetical protein
MMRHIWNLFAKSGSLWVAWIKTNLLRGKSFWQVPIPQVCSWSWRKLLKLRAEAKHFLQMIVGDGKDIHLWFDHWHPQGRLFDKYGFRVVFDARSRLDAKLSSVISNGQWNWPPARSEQLVGIQSDLCFVNLGNLDKPKWLISKDGKFSTAATWEGLREKLAVVNWVQMVWFPLAIPKHSFITWLAIKNALITGERMLHWGFQGDVQCAFCRNGVEDRNHIFFQCGFSKRVWTASLSKCNYVNPPVLWDDVLSLGLQQWKKKTLLATLCRLTFGASIYHIWRTRNDIRHGGSPCTEEQLLQKIQADVRLRVLGKGTFKTTPGNIVLCCTWGIPNGVLV